jgi:hypothetical protein
VIERIISKYTDLSFNNNSLYSMNLGLSVWDECTFLDSSGNKSQDAINADGQAGLLGKH